MWWWIKFFLEWPKLIYTLVILTIFFKQPISLTTTLRYFYETLSGPRVDKLLHLSIALVNSLFKKESQINDSFDRISFKIFMSIWWF